MQAIPSIILQISRVCDFPINLAANCLEFPVQKALPLLRDGASITLNGSVASVKGNISGVCVYNASKAAVRSFARTWTTDLKNHKIRVNVISAGPIDTPLLAGIPAEMVEGIKAQVPLGRLGTSEEIAKVALFLASDDSSFITGIELFVDGGIEAI